MTEALRRTEDVLGIGARKAQLQAVPTNRLKQLARYGLTSKAPLIGQLAEPRQTATLLAAARALEEHAVDDALDLFHVLMATRLISTAKRETKAGRLETLPRLERASTTLAATTRVFVEFLESAEDTVSVTGCGQPWSRSPPAPRSSAPRTSSSSSSPTTQPGRRPCDSAWPGSTRASGRSWCCLPRLCRWARRRPRPTCWPRCAAFPIWPAAASPRSRCARPRSTRTWCRGCGSERSSPTPHCCPVRSTATPTCYASWRACTGRCGAAMCSPRPRTGGPTRARSCSTAPSGSWSATRS